MCTYPKLIAAYHVLHRHYVPRHPPCALSSFIKLFYDLSVFNDSASSEISDDTN